jgi:hypothetical protein
MNGPAVQTVEGFDFQALEFDKSGKLTNPASLQVLIGHVAAASVTDVIQIAHGFRNSEAEALALYSRFLKTFRAHLGRAEFAATLAPRRFAVGGVFWPSKAFKEVSDFDAGGALGLEDEEMLLERVRARLLEVRDEDATPAARQRIDRAAALLPVLEGNPAAQDEFVDLVLSVVDETEEDPTEGLEQIRSQRRSELLAKLTVPIVLPTVDSARRGHCADRPRPRPVYYRRDNRRRRGISVDCRACRPAAEHDNVVLDEGAVRDGGNARRCGSGAQAQNRAS